MDRRNPSAIASNRYSVVLNSQTIGGFLFLADWRFPVPAAKRAYFQNKKLIVVEELGFDSKSRQFLFSAHWIA